MIPYYYGVTTMYPTTMCMYVPTSTMLLLLPTSNTTSKRVTTLTLNKENTKTTK